MATLVAPTIDRDQNLFVTFPRPTSEVFVVQSHLSNPTKRVEYPITGPLFDDLRPVSRERFAFFRWEGKVDRLRWERDQIFSLPAVVRKDGVLHFVIKDYVLQTARVLDYDEKSRPFARQRSSKGEGISGKGMILVQSILQAAPLGRCSLATCGLERTWRKP